MRKTSYIKNKTCRFVNSYWEWCVSQNKENPLIFLYILLGQVIHHQVVLYWKHVLFYSWVYWFLNLLCACRFYCCLLNDVFLEVPDWVCTMHISAHNYFDNFLIYFFFIIVLAHWLNINCRQVPDRRQHRRQKSLLKDNLFISGNLI